MTSPALGTNALTARGTQVATDSSTLRKLVGDAKTISELNDRIQTGIQLGGAIISAVDGIFEALFNFSPVDEWIKKPFSGDWDAMTTTAERWEALAANLTQTATAIMEVSNSVGDGMSWSGNAANEFKRDNQELSEALKAGVAPCQEGAQAMRQLAQLAEGTFDYIMNTLQAIADLLASVAADISIPVVGWVKGTWDTYQVIQSVTALITTTAERIQQMLATARSFANCLTHFSTAYNQSMSVLSLCHLTSGTPLTQSTQNMINAANFLTNPGEGLGKVGSAIKDGLAKAGNAAVDGGQALGGAFVDGVQGGQRLAADLGQWGNNVMFDGAQQVMDWGVDTGQTIQRGLNNAWTAGANTLDHASADALDALGAHGAAESMRGRADLRSTMNDVHNSINGLRIDQRQQEMRERGDAWQKQYNEWYDRGQDAFEAVGDSLQGQMNDGIDSLQGQKDASNGGRSGGSGGVHGGAR